VRLGNSTFQGGGIGGAVELLDWNNNLLWRYNYFKDKSHHQHHDIEPLPNGNVLILAWGYRSAAEAKAKGRLLEKDIWPTQIVEVQPVGSSEGIIVWEWHLWDHTMQDVSDTLPNFGIVREHPELLDINVGSGGGAFPGNINGIDWLHCNSVEYIEEHDWILISSKHLHEIFIIDHSTTSEEAAGHTGGNYGKGGDFLYRWGNPQNYRLGTLQNKVFSGQHDAIWIPKTDTSLAQIMVVNNGNNGRVDAWVPPLTAQGKFAIGNNAPFGPVNLAWSIEAGINSPVGCSARRLPNGNTVYCNAKTGVIEEVTVANEKVWKYQNPVTAAGPVEQGIMIGSGGFGGGFGSFRAEKYSRDYLTDTTLDVSPKGKIELNPYESDCVAETNIEPIDTMTIPMDTMVTPIDTMLIDTMTMPMDSMMIDSIIAISIFEQDNFLVDIFPNPIARQLTIKSGKHTFNSYELLGLDGKVISSGKMLEAIEVSNLPNAIYFLKLIDKNKIVVKRFLVQH